MPRGGRGEEEEEEKEKEDACLVWRINKGSDEKRERERESEGGEEMCGGALIFSSRGQVEEEEEEVGKRNA